MKRFLLRHYKKDSNSSAGAERHTDCENDKFSPPPQISVSQSCPDVVGPSMQDDATWERDRDLILQLRQVIGRGYSNQIIEEEFGYPELHNQNQLTEVPCDYLPAEDLLTEETNKSTTSDFEYKTMSLSKSVLQQQQLLSNSELSSACPQSPDAEHLGKRLFVHPPKLKPTRNALLNSLARMKILQLSEEPNMISPPIACSGRGTGGNAQDIISLKIPPGMKLRGSEFITEPSMCATEDKLATPTLESLKRQIDSMEISGVTKSYGETQKQCINWSDIRKLKAARCSPGSIYSDETPRTSPVYMINSQTSQISRQDNKVKSIAGKSILDLPNSLCEGKSHVTNRHSSEWHEDEQIKQDVSPQLSVQCKSEDNSGSKENQCSVSSSNKSVTPDKNLSWCSIRQQASHPKNVLLSEYIDIPCSSGSQNFSDVFCPLKELPRNDNELQLESVKDFPPL